MKKLYLPALILISVFLLFQSPVSAQHDHGSMDHGVRNDVRPDAPAAPEEAPGLPSRIPDGLYTGQGVIKSLDPANLTVELDHEAIPLIGWPRMVMTFKVAGADLLTDLKPGDPVSFDLKFAANDCIVVELEKK
ncbi:MAG: copper-binding protein [Deltaproteobacteria bacterium]|jgi:Cu/Ag efflux protein CusF|nr:copper-binding protein [Deltaproteobacteria bacterium]